MWENSAQNKEVKIFYDEIAGKMGGCISILNSVESKAQTRRRRLEIM